MRVGEYGEPARPFARWSKDTELAFLLALRRTGQVRKAAAEIGRSAAGAYGRRKRYPEFARAWDEMAAQQQAEWIDAHQMHLEARGSADDIIEGDDANGGGRLTPGRERADGWDARKRRAFLNALRRTKCVMDACAAAGMSDTAAYRLRSRSPVFAAAWAKALADAAQPSLREAALARAVDGWDEPIVHGGQVVGYKKRYSDGLLRDLLRDEQARAAACKTGRVSEGELAEVLLHRLALLDERLRDRERRKAERQWERWRLGWVDPALAAPTAADLAEDAEGDEG